MTTSPEAVIARLTLKQILARRRALALLALCTLPVLLALVSRAGETDPETATLPLLVQLFARMIVAVVLPLVALVIGTGAFGAEIEDGTALFVLAKPVARWRIVLTRLVVAAVATAVPVAGSVLASGLAAAGGWDRWGLTGAFAAAVCAGALLYCALFVLLSLSTRRALVAGLGYLVVWEGMLSGLFGGTRLLSVRHITLAVADRLSTTSPRVFDGQIPPTAALVMSIAIAVATTLYAVRRLRGFEVREAV